MQDGILTNGVIDITDGAIAIGWVRGPGHTHVNTTHARSSQRNIGGEINRISNISPT